MVLSVLLSVGTETGSVAQSAAPGPTDAGAGATASLPVPTAASIAAIAEATSSDPYEAATELVAILHAPDPAQASAALGEILRRAGVPVVSGDGPVLAWPDDLVLPDGAIYVEWLADLARAVRRGDGWTLTEFVDGLKDMGYLPEAAPAGAVGAGLGGWGKEPGDPMEAVFAGAIVRGLAAWRGELLIERADPEYVTIDPLQSTLILAHALGDATRRAVATGTSPGHAALTGRPPGRALAMAAADDPCAALADGVDTVPGQVTKDVLKEVVKDSLKKRLPGDLSGAVGPASDVLDKGLDILSLLILLMGAQLDLTADRSQTHFKHAAGDRSGHVNLKAKATFDSALAQRNLKCYKLAGLKVPPNGPLEGFKVGWMLTQKSGSYSRYGTGANPFPLFLQGKYLTATRADSPKICARLSCGQTTGRDGLSTLELYPPVELKPGKGALLWGAVGVKASLSKDDIPRFLKITDPKSLIKRGPDGAPAGVVPWAVKKVIDLLVSYLKRAGLPSQRTRIRVAYHGNDVYVVKGSGTAWLFFVSAPFAVDLYTCEGLREGIWKGTADFKADRSFFGDAANRVFKVNIPQRIRDRNPNVEEQLNLLDASGFPWVTLIEPYLQAWFEVDRRPDEETISGPGGPVLAAEHLDGPVGTVELYVGDTSLDAAMEVFGLGTAKFPIVGKPNDPRCEGGGPDDYYFEAL